MISDAKARKLKAGDKPLAVGGVPGLYLHPSARAGNGKFTLRFVSPATGKRRDMGLGTYPETGLARARQIASEARAQIANGIDPIAQRDLAKLAAASTLQTPTFEEAARRVHATLAPGYRNAKHSAQWITTLETYVFPAIGNRQVDTLYPADFAQLLRPIWLEKSETAGRVKQRCDRVMTWCIAHRFAQMNPVSAVDALLPKQRGKRDRVTHHPAVPWRQLPAVAEQLFAPTRPSAGRDALLFLILTAARSGEVRGAQWDEFDLEGGIWTVPAARMKAQQIHRVPLSAQALEILGRRAELSLGGVWVFSSNGRKPLSDMTLTKLLRDAKIESDSDGRTATAHGFRSSFRDWASENNYPRALAHTIHNATEAAYHRTDQLERRAPMMQAWGDFVV
ncbi:Prophage CP4-57 integrase [Aquimixticola soesokkakensis]|uniref:Prophage CP4-57 integrase n=1 Tax=Aquimixticola soesokkakensis TaxID=1519096 RepID=A0A1Y5TNQ8_9RHOB|nr:site-specific integrase [Aquimixticola soesokkakensis]SLN66450.1 Prophage CP4-57 integrase [Aquimixticola soesokkakensis]